jgi:hypothetical protein
VFVREREILSFLDEQPGRGHCRDELTEVIHLDHARDSDGENVCYVNSIERLFQSFTHGQGFPLY